MKISKQEVTYVDHMGTDLSVVNAARVSFDKESDWEIVQTDPHDRRTLELSEKDKKLINYLAKHNHWSPFSHTSISLRIKAPIFVARQLAKHQVGASWNEVSRRYVDSEPEFYFPEYWRAKAENVKQGSGENEISINYAHPGWHSPEDLVDEALNTYQCMISSGVCPEQARMVLPQNTMTEWIWTGSLYFFARVCHLRLDPHTQKETQEVAQMIYDICQGLFPVSWSALNPHEGTV